MCDRRVTYRYVCDQLINDTKNFTDSVPKQIFGYLLDQLDTGRKLLSNPKNSPLRNGTC